MEAGYALPLFSHFFVGTQATGAPDPLVMSGSEVYHVASGWALSLSLLVSPRCPGFFLFRLKFLIFKTTLIPHSSWGSVQRGGTCHYQMLEGSPWGDEQSCCQQYLPREERIL